LVYLKLVLTSVLLTLFAACVAKTEQLTLSTGTIVYMKPEGEHRYEVLDFKNLTHEELIEFFYVIPGKCPFRHVTLSTGGMFGFLSKKDVIYSDCRIPTFLNPVPN